MWTARSRSRARRERAPLCNCSVWRRRVLPCPAGACSTQVPSCACSFILRPTFCVQVIEPKMVEEIRRLRGLVTVGTVGGSDLAKQIEQLGQSGEGLTADCSSRRKCC